MQVDVNEIVHRLAAKIAELEVSLAIAEATVSALQADEHPEEP